MANAALRALDGLVHAALASAGLADAVDVQYFPKDSTASIPCRVYVDRAVQVVGETGQMVAPRDEVAFLLDGMSVKPASGGRVTVGTDAFVLNKLLSDDGSLSRWVVRNG